MSKNHTPHKPAEPQAAAPAAPAAPVSAETPKVTKVRVRTQQGEMLHLLTNVRFTTDSKLVELDAFVQAQLDAGKLVISAE